MSFNILSCNDYLMKIQKDDVNFNNAIGEFNRNVELGNENFIIGNIKWTIDLCDRMRNILEKKGYKIGFGYHTIPNVTGTFEHRGNGVFNVHIPSGIH